jgi:hypothetical protein
MMSGQNVIKGCNFLGIVRLFILITVLLFLSIPVCAGDNPGKEEEDAKQADKEWVQKIEEILIFFTDRKEQLYPISLSMDVGFNGHKAGDSSLFRLNISTDFISYQYPSEFIFKAGTALQFKNNILQEDVTTLLVGYNYYFKSWLKMYGFVERFSDSFLSIQHRYEIGGGISFKCNLWKKEREIEREKEYYRCKLEEVFNEAVSDAVSLRECIVNDLPSLYYYNTKKKADELVKEEKCFYDMLKNKFARVSASIYFTIFSELEKAEIETCIDEQITGEDGTIRIFEGTIPTKFPLEGEQRFRFTVRPRLEIKIRENFTINGHIYLKYPLGKPQKAFGRTDYRYDACLRPELKLESPFSWAKKMFLYFEYQRHYDNLPPRLPESIIAEYLSNGKILRKTIANDTHEEFLFGLKIQF